MKNRMLLKEFAAKLTKSELELAQVLQRLMNIREK